MILNKESNIPKYSDKYLSDEYKMLTGNPIDEIDHVIFENKRCFKVKHYERLSEALNIPLSQLIEDKKELKIHISFSEDSNKNIDYEFVNKLAYLFEQYIRLQENLEV